MMSSRSRHQCSTPIGQDSEEPRIEPDIFPKTREAVVHPHECILHCFFGILIVSQHVPGKTQATRIVEFHYLKKRVLVAAFCPDRNRWIDIAHLHSPEVRFLPQITPLERVTPPPSS